MESEDLEDMGYGEESVGGHKDLQLSTWRPCEVDKVAQDLFTSYNFSPSDNCCLWLSSCGIWQMESLQLMSTDDYNWCYISG